MKLISPLIGIVFLGAITICQGATLLTFDDLPPGAWPAPGYSVIPNGYGGLNWNNFGVLDGYNLTSNYGYYAGIVSPSNVAFNISGTTAALNAGGGLFNLQSGYLTAALNLDTPLGVRVQGFRGATELYDNTYTVYRTGPSFIAFDYPGVDRVTFDSIPQLQQFALDNLSIAVVPEPGFVTLIGLAAALGCYLRTRTESS